MIYFVKQWMYIEVNKEHKFNKPYNIVLLNKLSIVVSCLIYVLLYTLFDVLISNIKINKIMF